MTQWPEADSVRVRWLILVVAVMIGLTAGWPLINTTVANRQAIAPGSTMYLGPAPASSARVTFGSGWTMAPAQSNPHLDVSMNRGPVSVYAAFVKLTPGWRAGQLWSGLRGTLRIRHPGARLGPAAVTTNVQGLTGLVGVLVAGNRSGTATIFPAPSRRFAVIALVLAPRGTSRGAVAAVQRTLKTVHFPQARRDLR